MAIDEWERIQKAKNLLEHVYLAGIIEDRRHSKPTCSLNDLLKQEGFRVAVWKVDLISEAKADFAKLERDPRHGEPLGDKAGIDLRGYLSHVEAWLVARYVQ